MIPLMEFDEISEEVAKLFGGRLPNDAMAHLFRRLKNMEAEIAYLYDLTRGLKE